MFSHKRQRPVCINRLIHNLPLGPAEKVILTGIASLHRDNLPPCPSYKDLGRWIGRSRRIVHKVLNSPELKRYLVRKRRGFKQTNIYYLVSWLWRIVKGKAARPTRLGYRQNQERVAAPSRTEIVALMGRFGLHLPDWLGSAVGATVK